MNADEFPPLIYVDIQQERRIRPGRPFKRPQNWRWRAISGGNQKILAVSSESYTNREDCLRAVDLLFGNGSNVYLRQQDQGNQVLRMKH